jgi:hypothetical protein
MMRRSIFAAALLLTACNADAQTIDGALTAYSHNRVADAEAILARIAADPAADGATRATALRQTARIAWVIDGDAERALETLRRAASVGPERCPASVLTARVLEEAQQAERLVSEADALIADCDDPAEADRIRLRAAEAALDLAAATPARGPAMLERASALLAALQDGARDGLQGSAIALQLALLRSDPSRALAAWRNYFWLSATDVPQGIRRHYPAARPVFEAGLEAGARPDARLALVDLLVRAGFAREAERFAAATGLPSAAAPHPLWRKASGYFEARRELEAALLASNRRVARGGQAANLEAALDRFRTRLMSAAGLSGNPEEMLRDGYGLTGQAGDTGGFASIHYGHIVQDERRTIEQYGHRAEIGFLALDHMLANGFESWLWDGSAAAGGWTSPGPVIVQVRTEYVASPLGAWNLFSGGRQRRELDARQAERAAADLAALANVDVAHLAGLHDRLAVQVAEQVGARARALAAQGGDLRRAFLDEYWRATFQQSILTHEGRHALDRTLVTGLRRLDDANLEYRAKLSELALADYPRLALLNINDRTIGGGTPHGRANEQVLRAYAEWIRTNAAAVAGYDPAVPALAQIDRLTDAQIRAVARGLDPIANP